MTTIDDLDTPAIVIDLARVEANLKRAQAHADAGQPLRRTRARVGREPIPPALGHAPVVPSTTGVAYAAHRPQSVHELCRPQLRCRIGRCSYELRVTSTGARL